MDTVNIIIEVAVCVFLLWLVLKIFAKPIKWILKLLLNAAIGFVLLFLVNFFGSYIGISVNVGWISALVAGVLGIPGVILLILIENVFL